MSGWFQTAFALTVAASFELPGLQRASSTDADLALRLAAPGELDRLWTSTGARTLWATTFSDGCSFEVQAGDGGGHLMTYGQRARFHLSERSIGELVCEPADLEDPSWQRQLLDTVLLCASSLYGAQLLHAGAVLLPGGVAAIAGPTGAGKSTLTAALMRRGHTLLADDIVALDLDGDGVRAYPGPPLMNLPVDLAAGGEFGAVIATFEDDAEAWVEVRHSARQPARLAAVFLLERGVRSLADVQVMAPNPLHLMPHSVGLRDGQDHDRRRFELFADVAERVPVYRLRADVGASPAHLANLVERTVPGGTPGTAEAV